MNELLQYLLLYGFSLLGITILVRVKYGFWISIGLILIYATYQYSKVTGNEFLWHCLTYSLPMLLACLIAYVFLGKEVTGQKVDPRFSVRIKTKNGILSLNNIRRGISIIGAAGSGKTQSVVYPLLEHLSKENFCGVIHDYKDFEITELAKPLFDKSEIPFYTISFEPIQDRVNPVAPRYLPDEESVNEVSRVLVENLLELKDTNMNATTRFFNDAVEGLIAGMLWRLKTDYSHVCTIPHMIAFYQQLSTSQLINVSSI
jgi:hypothetical protein